MAVVRTSQHPWRIWRALPSAPLVGLIAFAFLGTTVPGPALTPVSAGSGTPTHLRLTDVPASADPATDFDSQPKVEVLDKDGNVVDSATHVVLTLQPVGTDLSGKLTCTDTSLAPTDGVAQFAGCQVDHGGRYHVVASSTGLASDTSDELFVSGPAKVLFSGEPNGGAAGAAWTGQPQLTVVDGNGVTLTDVTTDLGLVIKPGTGAVGALLTCTEADRKTAAVAGVATFHGCAIDKAATGYQLYGIDIHNKVYGTSSAFNVAGGTPSQLVFTAEPSSGAGGIALPGQPHVAIEDASGNILDLSHQITLAITSGSGTSGAALTCTTPVAAVQGVATFTGCAIDKAGTGYTLTATDSTASLSEDSTAFNIGAGNATALVFTNPPSGGAAGSAFDSQPAVELRDDGGNPKSGSVTLSLTGGDATAHLSCAVNPQSAVAAAATFSGCTVDKPGSNYRLHAVSGGLSVDSDPFDVTTGSAAALSFTTSPNDSTGGSSFGHQPLVHVTDAGGNPAAGNVTLTITPGTGTPGAHLDCANSTVSASGGDATFSGCDIDLDGTGYSLTATSGTTHTVSQRFDVTTGPAARLRFTTPPGDGTGGQALSTQPVVTVEDAGGNPITDSAATIHLAVTPGTGSGALTCASNPLPVTRGAAGFDACRIDKTASAYRLTATGGGFTTTSTPFAVSVGPATQLLFTAQPASATAGQVFGTAPTVRVADAGGNAVPGAQSLTLAITPGTGAAGAGLSCTALTVSTGSDGIAGFPGCVIDTAAGGYTLRATGAGLTTESPSFPVVAAPPAPLEQAPTAVPAAQTLGGRHYAVNPTAVTDFVNSATGNLVYPTSDLTVAGLGLPLNVTRTYNSLDTAVGAFGKGWSSLLDLSVTIVGNSATVRGEDGQRVGFGWNAATSSWVGDPGARSTLKCSAKVCTVTRRDGQRFDVNGSQLLDVFDPNGIGLTFGYTAGKLSSIKVAGNGTSRVVAVTTNAAGRVTKLQTPALRTTSYGYTGDLLTSYTDAGGKTWTYGYTGGLLSSVTDPLAHQRLAVGYAGGRVSTLAQKGSARHLQDTFSWDAGTQTSTRSARTSVDGTLVDEPWTDTYLGNVLVRQTTPLGATMRYSYDARVNLTEVQDPHGWTTVTTFSPANDLLSQSTPITSTSASVVRFTYDSSHRPLTQTDPDGNTTTYVYNGANIGSILPPGIGSIATKLVFNTLGELTSMTNAIGKQDFSYDSFGNRTVTLQSTLPGTALNGAGSLSSYDEAGHLITLVDARGTTRHQPNAFKSTWTYDANGHLLTTSTPTGTSSNSYDNAGDVLSSTDAKAQVSTFAWDEATLTRTTHTAAGDLVQVFDPSGNVLTETANGGGTTEHRYDASGRETSTIAPSGLVTDYTYDVIGNVIDVTDNAGMSIQRQFDSRGLQVRNVVNGAATRTTYDALGNITSFRDAGGALTTRSYDPHNNVSRVTDDAGTTSYLYDRADNVVTRTDGNGHTTSFTYDGLSRMTSQSSAGHKTTYGYDEIGNLVTTTDPDGRVETDTYDAANRVTKTVYAWAGHPSITVNQGYDALGQRTSMTDSTGTHTYAYDAAGHLTSGNGFSYDYSDPGKVTETYPDGTVVTYDVDDTGALMGLTSGAPGTADYVHAAYVRDARRRTTAVAFSNGILDTRGYDGVGNVVSDQLQRAGVDLASDVYAYDAGGNRTAQVQTAAGSQVTNTYGYDGSNRLTNFSSSTVAAALPPVQTSLPPSASSSVVSGGLTPPSSIPALPVPGSLPAPASAYGYDNVGNRTSAAGGRSYSSDAFDQLTNESGPGGAVSRSYDLAGDLVKVTRSSGVTTFSYDAARRLVKVVTPSTTVDYTYDGDGNRVTKKVGATTTTLTWDPRTAVPQLALEKNGATLIRRYFNGDGPVAMQTPSATFFFHLDPVGSVAELSDADGNVVAGYSYDGFGQVTVAGSSPPDNPILFQGQYLDIDTGLYDMRARNYDPTTGRFTQRDPLATRTGLPLVSPYAFVGNRPTVLTDPTGQRSAEDLAFHAQATTDADIAQDTRYGTTGTMLSVKAVSKLGGYSAALDGAAAEGGVATAEAETGMALKGAGIGLAIIGIGLQTYITVETCKHGTVQACVGAAVGTAVSTAFFVGCTALTEGAGAILCGLAGAAISAGLQYVITEFGPQIVDGLIEFGHLAQAGLVAGAQIVGDALVTAGKAIADVANEAIGGIVSGYNTAVAALSSGFQTALQTLVDAGYTALQLATVLADTFAYGVEQAISGLVGLGYAIADAAQVLKDFFTATAQEAAQVLKDAFGYAVDQIGTALKDLYDLTDQAMALVLKGIGAAAQQVAAFLHDVYNDAADAIAAALDAVNYGVQQIAAALKDVLHTIDVAIAQILKDLSHTVQEIAAALHDALAEVAAAAAATLKAIQFAATAVAEGLRDIYNAAAQFAAQLLKDVGFVVNEVATALHGAFNAVAQTAAQILKNIAFAVTEIGNALKDVFSQAAAAAATILRDIGYAATQVATALKDAFAQFQQAAAQILKDIGFVVTEVATALKDAFQLLDQAVATVLKNISFAVDQVATALRDVFNDAAQAAAQVLKTIGYAVDAVAGVLQSVFAQAAAAAAQILHAISFAFDQIASALNDVFHAAADFAASILKDLGAAADVIAGILGDIWHLATDVIAGLLSAVGFLADAISAIGGAFEDFGNAVADFFSSIF